MSEEDKTAKKAAKQARKAITKLTERTIWNALMLASAGVYVFPLGLDSPTLKANGGVKAQKVYYKGLTWSTKASTDPEVVADMFERWPGSAIGIATGPSGLIGVDLDATPEKNGRSSLELANLETPFTHSYPSLGGGEHHLYRAPKKTPIKTASDITTPDGVKLYGVDIRATGGMIVYYGPMLEAPPVFEKAPKWALIPATPSGPAAEPSLDMAEWLASLHKGEATLRTVEALAAVRDEGMSHGELLVATNRLAELGSQGAAGVAEAVLTARTRYLTNYPSHAKAWDDAMLDAARYFGKPLPTLAIKMPLMAAREPVSKKHKGKEIEQKPKPPATVPDDFFEPKTGVRAKLLGEHVNYDHALGRGVDNRAWHYEGGVWREADAEVTRRTIRLLGDRYRVALAALARDMVMHDAKTPVITGTPHADLINVQNGMLDWRSGRLVPHDATYHSATQLPLSFAPGPHPHFDRWVAEVAPGSLTDTVWELIAYSMLNGNPFQKAAMLVGQGGTGKGTLIRLIEHMAGVENVSHLSPAAMTTTFEPAELFGKLLNTVGDLDGKYLPDTGPFKAITGGDAISTQRKNRDPFSFQPWAFHIFAANTIAVSPDVTSGFFRRWLIVPFEHQVDRSIPFDERKLWAERDAIFAEAVKRLPSLIEANDFTEGIELAIAQETFATDSDVVRSWLSDDEHIELAEPSSDHRTTRAHLYDVYASWCQRTGHARPLSRMTFSKRIRQIGYDMPKVAGLYYVRGIKVDSLPITQTFGTGYNSHKVAGDE